MVYSSDVRMISNQELSKSKAKDIIRENFDPSSKVKSDDIEILISTDILSEGMNMHRSNKILNYDLPWNPTKVLQRAGRINRIGTEHKNLDIYNFFPVDESEKEIGLKLNITRKIQAFHDTLGEDAKYLTDNEEVSSHNLFGQKLFEKLKNIDTISENEDEQSHLKYLKIIQGVRDNDPLLFDKIKNLPKKSRLTIPGKNNDVLTFFRSGELKKFVISKEGEHSKEINFFEAAKLFESTSADKSINLTEKQN